METTSSSLPFDPSRPAESTSTSRSPWREALLAGLPHLWIGLTVAASNLQGGRLPELGRLGITSDSLSLAVFVIMSLAVVAYAWRHAWPLWTAAWYGYTFWLLVIAFVFLAYRLGNDNWVINVVVLLGAVGAIGLGYLLLFRFFRLHAILVALFLLPVASQLGLEAIPTAWEAFLALWFGLLAALVSAFIVRTQNWPWSVAAALLANLFAGLALTYVCFFKVEIPGFYGDSPLEALLAPGGYIMATAALFLGPWIVWGAFDALKRKLR